MVRLYGNTFGLSPIFRRAIELYKSRGFVAIERYNDVPEDFLFFGLKL